MANLYTGNFTISDEFKTLSSLTDITFTSGTTYTIQVYNPCYLREGTTGKGFLIIDSTPIKYVAGADALYIGQYGYYNYIAINIAD